MFEKIPPPPTGRNPIAPRDQKPRGVIVQIFARLTESRVERARRVENNIDERRRKDQPE